MEIVGARIQDVVRDKLFGLERLLKECEPEMSLQGALAFLDATKMILKVTEVYYFLSPGVIPLRFPFLRFPCGSWPLLAWLGGQSAPFSPQPIVSQ